MRDDGLLVMTDFETKAIYSVCQAYRHQPITDQVATVAAYEDLKAEFIGRANKLFWNWLKKQPKVYGRNHGVWSALQDEMDDHSARLVSIEKLGNER